MTSENREGRGMTDDDFKATLRHAIADALDVSLPTLDRWLTGQNLPHPAMREGIVRRLPSLLGRLRTINDLASARLRNPADLTPNTEHDLREIVRLSER